MKPVVDESKLTLPKRQDRIREPWNPVSPSGESNDQILVL